jgi:hypothetical protein
MSDEGKRGPKFPTPASGVRPVRAGTVSRERAEADAELEALARIDRNRAAAFDEDTPVNMPLPAIAQRINERTKTITTSTGDIQNRVGKLEGGLSDARTEIGHVAMQVVSLDAKVDVLVEESKESRRERLDRERAAEKRAEAELAFRRERALKIIGIVVPLVAALGTLFAGLAGAFK